MEDTSVLLTSHTGSVIKLWDKCFLYWPLAKQYCKNLDLLYEITNPALTHDTYCCCLVQDRVSFSDTSTRRYLAVFKSTKYPYLLSCHSRQQTNIGEGNSSPPKPQTFWPRTMQTAKAVPDPETEISSNLPKQPPSGPGKMPRPANGTSSPSSSGERRRRGQNEGYGEWNNEQSRRGRESQAREVKYGFNFRCKFCCCSCSSQCC